MCDLGITELTSTVDNQNKFSFTTYLITCILRGKRFKYTDYGARVHKRLVYMYLLNMPIVMLKVIALYAPLQFFIIDKKDVINCTAISNNQLRIIGTKNYAQLGLLYKNISF